MTDREIDGAIVANSGETVRHLAVLGMGLARLADYQVRDDLRTGALVSVLDEPVVDTEPFHTLYPGRLHTPRRVKAFLDFAAPRLRAALTPSGQRRR